MVFSKRFAFFDKVKRLLFTVLQCSISSREKDRFSPVFSKMADHSHVGNGINVDKSLVKAAEISRVVITVQGAQEMLQETTRGLPALGDSTYRKGQLRQAPSYLLGKPLHDFDATAGNGVSRHNVYIT